MLTTRHPDRESGGYVMRRADWRVGDELRLDVHGTTNIGTVRPTNDDAFLIADVGDLPQGDGRAGGVPLLGVADGVGGRQGGSYASRLALRTALRDAARCGRHGAWSSGRDAAAVDAALRDTVDAAQDALVRCGHADPSLARMATTLTLGLMRGWALHLAHAGDSRCYLHRRGALTRLTADHTMARVMEESGADRLPATSRFHHILTSVLAANQAGVDVETRSVRLRPDDTLVFCTDGLYRALPDAAIEAALATSRSAVAAARQLMQLALDADGSDNVTVVVARARTRLG